MKVTEVLKYAMDFAEKLEKNRNWKVHSVNTLFIGILKAAETKARQREIMDEIDELNGEIKKLGMTPREMRLQMREHLPENINEDEENKKMTDIMSSLSNLKIVTSVMMLKAILKNKTKIIEDILPSQNNSDNYSENTSNFETEVVERRVEKHSATKRKVNHEVQLEELVQDIRKIREQLLQSVFGQNHAVRTFIDGLWNSELSSLSDKERFRPRGTFLFAGPPGVGKTYFAEQVAKYMDLPFLRLDMSGYSYKDANLDLIGYAKTYKDAKRGILTNFVTNNPRCVILFDEIEKANMQVIHLFLQILDAGTVTELYDDTKVSFKDTTIIFTTNAGKNLYENDEIDLSTVSQMRIIEALQTEINPATETPYFPAAICSRLSAGNVIMFQHLEAQHLEKVCKAEFKKVANQIGETFGLNISADENVYSSLMYAFGGKIDARDLTSKTGAFLREEMKKLFDLFSESSIADSVHSIEKIKFCTEMEKADDAIKKMYQRKGNTGILFIGIDYIPPKLSKALQNYNIYCAEDGEEASEVLNKYEIHIVMLLIEPDSDIIIFDEHNDENLNKTGCFFDYIPIGANDLSKRRGELIRIHKQMPNMPIYVLETNFFKIDRELEIALMEDGARGVLHLDYQRVLNFVNQLEIINTAIYMQKQANMLKKLSKVLHFETAPIINKDKHEVNIRLRNFSLEQMISVEDQYDVLYGSEKEKFHFTDIIGANSAKEELQFFVDYLKNPKEFLARGMEIPKGVLLYGAPGTGKTMLAKAMAGEANVAFLSTEGSSFVNKYVGVGADNVRKLFARARKYAPSIIFIDEIDTIGRQRTGSEDGREIEATLNALLVEMDGIKVDPKRPVFVLAATNYGVDEENEIGSIDTALIRRFNRKIKVDLPNKNDRKEFLSLKLNIEKTRFLGSTRIIDQIADRSIGMSLANLESVIELAKRNAFKQKADLSDAILDEAFETIVHGEKKEFGKTIMERIARHEAGHALIGWKMGETPSYISIVARGNHAGYVQHSNNSQWIKTKSELIGRIRSLLGGRAAEIVYYGKEDGISTGASNDLMQATEIAKNLMCSYGMDDDMGLAVFRDKYTLKMRESTRLLGKINKLLKEQLEEAICIIQNSKEEMDDIVKILLEKNQLNSHEFEEIMERYQ